MNGATAYQNGRRVIAGEDFSWRGVIWTYEPYPDHLLVKSNGNNVSGRLLTYTPDSSKGSKYPYRAFVIRVAAEGIYIESGIVPIETTKGFWAWLGRLLSNGETFYKGLIPFSEIKFV